MKLFPFLKRKTSPSELGEAIFEYVLNKESIGSTTVLAFDEFRDALSVSRDRFGREYLHLRIFAADYALDSYSGKIQQIDQSRGVFNLRLVRAADEARNLLGSVQNINDHLRRYGEAADRPHHLGPVFFVGDVFLEYLGDAGPTHDASLHISACQLFAGFFKAVSEVINSVKLH